jgi:hypothetical protein
MISIATYRGVSLQSNWIEKVITQLNRDLSLAGYDHAFNVKSNLLDFQEQCINFFEALLEKNDQQLYNLLYRIDVDQKKIYSGHGKPQLLIAQLVIEREFQKVVLKDQFS